MKRLRLRHIIAWLLLVIMGLIVFHAPMTVFVESRWPQVSDIVKAWKELLLGGALILLAIEYTRLRAWKSLARDTITLLVALYAMVHIVSVWLFPLGLQSTVAGLMIDLRYVAYFVGVYTFLKLYPAYRKSFFSIALMGAYLVVGFAVLQLVLSHDFLKYIGYGDATIQPYLTVDKNPDYVRLQSTMRGPNPLGAYAVMVIAGVMAYLKSRGDLRQVRFRDLPIGLGLAAVIALWCSYSRSAVVGLVVAFGIIAWTMRHRISRRRQLIALGSLIVIAGALVGLLQGTSFWHNVVVHDNPTTGAVIDSNQGHADSLRDGMARMAVQPLGAGVGSTGSASLYGDKPLVIENQYLFIAHEVGWFGLVVFVALFVVILRSQWRERDNWWHLALFASGIALAVIGLMQPVWVDDTVAIVWWGLAGAAYGMKGKGDGTTTNKKTARTT